MNKYLKVSLYGVLVIVLVTIGEFLVTLPFGDYMMGDVATMAQKINLELLLAALPALLVTALCAWLMKTKTMLEAIERGVLWMVMLAVNYAVIGVGNANFWMIFGSVGFYALLTCALVGPLVYAKLKRLP